MGEFVRLIHPRHYDEKRGHFASSAFSVSSNKGVSIVDIECAIACSGDTCSHIAAYYPNSISGDPAIYWPLSNGEIPEKATFEQSPSQSGDDCHHDAFGLTKGEARRVALAINPDDCFICDAEAGLRNCVVADFNVELIQ